VLSNAAQHQLSISSDGEDVVGKVSQQLDVLEVDKDGKLLLA
jgi:hypothetical protein